jgi:hypothetical protein
MNFILALSNKAFLSSGFAIALLRVFLFDMETGLVLSNLGWRVLETFEGLLDRCWYQEVHLAPDVVPLYGESAILFTIPIAQTLIVFLFCFQQVLSILLANVLYYGVVNKEGENNGAGFVLP